jgi:glycosyltransferase involved in cell wall biosynthesis
MPTYNCAKYITQSVKSVLNQTYKEFEFLIIDDGSEDNTEEIISRFKDSRIKYIKRKNRGTSAALNYGISVAEGNWIARIDSDDLNTSNRLERQVNFINENNTVNILSCWSVYFNDRGKILFLLREPTRHEQIYEYLDLHNPLNQSGIFYRKDLIQKERYDENFLFNEDFELFYRIRDKVKFGNLPEFLVYTRVRKDSKTFNQTNRNIYSFLHGFAFHSLQNARSKGEHFYWSNIIAWLNFFYGDRKESRKFFGNAVRLKNTLAYILTFLPEKLFYKFTDSRMRYRLMSMFEKKKFYKQELKLLLND